MADITGNQTVRIRMPVDTAAEFEARKHPGVFGIVPTSKVVQVCPSEGADFIKLLSSPDSVPAAGTLTGSELVTVLQAGEHRRTNLAAIAAGGGRPIGELLYGDGFGGVTSQPGMCMSAVGDEFILGNLLSFFYKKLGTSDPGKLVAVKDSSGELIARNALCSDIADLPFVPLSAIADNTGTANASPAIQAALSAGIPLIVDNGSYRIDTQITVPSGAHIAFQEGASFFQPSATDYAQGMLHLSGVSGVVLDSPSLIGSLIGTTAGAAINDAIRVTGSSYVRIRNSRCSGFYGNGIRVNSGSSDVVVSAPKCYDNQQNGILVSDSPDCELVDPICYSNGTTTLEHGIYISGNSGIGSARTRISGIAKTYSNSGSGIQVSKYSTNVVISDVQTYSNGTNGMNIASDTGTTEMTVTVGSVRAFGNTLRGLYIQQGTGPLRLSADKLCAYGNGREGVYFEGITNGFIVASVDSYLNQRDGIRIVDSAGTACRDGVIGSARSWDNSQSADGAYSGISLENAVRCVFGQVSVRSTNAGIRHNYGISVSGTSQLNSISSGDVYGSKTSDFVDSSAAGSTCFGTVITGDNTFPASKSSYAVATSTFSLTGTLSTALSSPTLPIGRYAVICNARAYNSSGVGQIELKIIANGADQAATGPIDIQNSIRCSIPISSVFTLSAAGTIDLRGRFLSGACDLADRSMTVIRIG